MTGLACVLSLALAAATAVAPPISRTHADGPSKGAGAVYRLPFSQRQNANRTGYYYISRHRPAAGRPIILLLHGYKGDGLYVANWFKDLAEVHGAALIAPDSLGDQWQTSRPGYWTADAQHCLEALDWLSRHLGGRDDARLAAVGHSYGTRMAAYLATNFAPLMGVGIMHGRFVPATLGSRHAAAFFSGSPRDPWFHFPVMQAQYPSWHNGPKGLHTYDCPTCFHPPSPPELRDLMVWVAEGTEIVAH